MRVGLKWTDEAARASRDRAVEQIAAIAHDLAEGREVTVESTIADEVRRRDAQLWARLEARGRES